MVREKKRSKQFGGGEHVADLAADQNLDSGLSQMRNNQVAFPIN